MTAQIPDRILIDDVEHNLHTLPLRPILDARNPRPAFRAPHSGNWRGYTADWTIVDNQLFLTGIAGTICTRAAERGVPASSWCRTGHIGQCSLQPIGVGDLFPGEERVHAIWYSGDLVMPAGEMTRYVHAGFASSYARYRIITVNAGQVLGSRFAGEPPAEPAPSAKRWWQRLGKRRGGPA